MPSSENIAASNVTLTRRANLLALFQEYVEAHLSNGGSPKGVEQIFAQHLQMLPSRLSQIKSSRPIGDKLAKQIESLCARPAGWLDVERDEYRPTPAEDAFILKARNKWRELCAKDRKRLLKMLLEFS